MNMQRYKIIDTLRIHPNDIKESRFDIPAYAVLSQEETEAKFKEIWEASWEASMMGIASECVHGTEEEWDEFKKTL